MNKSQVLSLAENVVRAHVSAINDGDTVTMRSQLIGSDREKPFQVYCDAMLKLRPIEIRSLRVGEPSATQRPPGPRTRIRIYLQLASGDSRSNEELPVWVFTDTGEAKIASRILMRKH